MMRRWQTAGIILIGALVMSACGSGASTSQATQPAGGGGLPGIAWSKDPKTVIVRLDRTLTNEAQVASLNRLPLCTVHGDGHVVWLNSVPPASEEVLEARIDDDTLKSFLDDFLIKGQKFYSLPDYAAAQLPPEGRVSVESVTVNISNEVRTIRSYGTWPNNEFNTILDKCVHLTTQPITYLPLGAWLSVQPTTGATSDPRILWQANAPFKLSDVTAGAQPMWISGPVLNLLWTTQRRTLGAVQWMENNTSYRVVLQVPGISRESPAAPAVTPTVQAAATAAAATPITTITPVPSATSGPTSVSTKKS